MPACAIPRGSALLVLVSTQDAERWSGLLDTAEHDRAAAYRHEPSRAEFIVGRGVAKTLLARVLDVAPASIHISYFCPVCRGSEHGKPYVAEAGAAEFSLAHGGGHVFIALTNDGPLGVDVEAVRPITQLASVARRVLTPAELAAFESRTGDAALDWFYDRWCAKEAITKRTGRGLSDEFSRIDADDDANVLALPRQQLSAGLCAAVALPPTVHRLVWTTPPDPPEPPHPPKAPS